MTDLTPSTNKPIVGDRRTVRFALADDGGDVITLAKAKCVVLQQKPGSATPTDVTASSVQAAAALTLTVDLDTPGLWVWRVEYNDADVTGFVEVEEFGLLVNCRGVPAAS